MTPTSWTQIVTTHGEQFRRPDKIEPGMWINKRAATTTTTSNLSRFPILSTLKSKQNVSKM